jgi:hypothetical protein
LVPCKPRPAISPDWPKKHINVIVQSNNPLAVSANFASISNELENIDDAYDIFFLSL